MKKKILSILMALTLCLSLLPTAAFAEEHTCADEDGDHWCDACWEYMPELCGDEDADEYCDVCWSHLSCADEDGDHWCDASCGNTLSECGDEDHDHSCDLCGDVYYCTEPTEEGYYACEAGCGAVMVNISGEYTQLNYHGFEEGTLADGTAEISVAVPNYQTEDFEAVENGSVTVFWTDEEGGVFENHTVADVPLTDGKATVSFTDLPIEILHRGNLLYKPADPAMYLPDDNGMVLEYQDNVHRLTVDANVQCTINGVYEDELYLFPGTEVTVLVMSDAFGTLSWSYEEGSAEHRVIGSIVSFTMPEEDIYAVLEYACVSCIDEDSDHWCDFCDERLSECSDGDNDHYCDLCREFLYELCTDGEDDMPHVCDICLAGMPELCSDENDDHTCDLCGSGIEGVCCDENGDHLCDNAACGGWISFCEDCDWDEDNICDLCGEGIYPSAGELNIKAAAGDSEITVTWEAMEDVGEDKVASYIVSCCLENSYEPLQQAVYTPGSEAYTHTFTGVENDVVYDVSVDAVYTLIKEGYEEPFSATAATTVTALPGAPTIVSAVYGNGAVTVEWEAPENKGFPEIRSYLVIAEQNGFGFGDEVEATGDTMRHTLGGLLNGNTYQIYVSAVNEVGQGAVATTTVEIPLLPYQLEIGGVAVSEENMNDVLGDGTVSWDPVTFTLTLDNAHISVTQGNYGIRSKTFMKLKLVGENSIACSGVYGFHSSDDVTVIGSGSLEVTANDVGIYIAGGSEVGGLYLQDDVKLTVTSGDVTSGNSYGVRVDDVLEVRDNAQLTATAGTAPERSCGIYAYDECNVYDNAVVIATGGDQPVDLNTDCDGIRTTHITVEGGSVTAIGGTAATTNGIFTQTFDMHGGTLTAISGSTAGGTRFGPSVALQATRSFNLTGGTVNATAGSAANDQSCGVLVSNGELRVDGGSLSAQSGEANFSHGIKAGQLGLFSGRITAQGAQGVWCSDGVSVDGSAFVDGGVLQAAAADAENYSYGLQAFEMVLSGGEVEATAGSAANSYGIWAFGKMTVLRNHVRPNPYTPGFIGTKISAVAEDGYAVYSRTGVEIGEGICISLPESGSVVSVGEDELTRYYTVADADGTAAKHAEMELLTYKVSIKGLDISYEMAVEVPAGWSVNEAYCEKYGVEDFSEILPMDKDGYLFCGWYSDEGEFSFGDDITGDVTVRAKWRKIASGNPDPRPAEEEEETGKTFDDVHGVGHWAEEAVDFVTDRGIFKGATESDFCPDRALSREEMWMVLARMSGENPADMTGAQAWAVSSGISDGSEPALAISREQLVTMLWRWAKAQGMDVSVGEETNILSYEDAFFISEYAIPAFQWACGAGVVTGYADATLKPAESATRAHAAAMLMNFLEQ